MAQGRAVLARGRLVWHGAGLSGTEQGCMTQGTAPQTLARAGQESHLTAHACSLVATAGNSSAAV